MEPLSVDQPHNRLTQLLASHSFILTEAAVIEALQRLPKIATDPHVANALLIYDSVGRVALSGIYGQFIDVARQAGIPLVLATPTWRAGHERVRLADAPVTINQDAAAFLTGLRGQVEIGIGAEPILIGGLLVPKNDAYRPEQGLSTTAADVYHQGQAEQLVTGGVDFLLAATLPALPEAKGIARAMARTMAPYVISFVLNAHGHLLDGSQLAQTVAEIDDQNVRPPAGYMINCAYPSFFKTNRLPRHTLQRIIGFQANAAARDHNDLDKAQARLAEPVSDWGQRMIALHQQAGIKILGGCCGTRVEHLRYLTDRLGFHENNRG